MTTKAQKNATTVADSIGAALKTAAKTGIPSADTVDTLAREVKRSNPTRFKKARKAAKKAVKKKAAKRIYISSITGRFVSKAFAEANPGTTVSRKVKAKVLPASQTGLVNAPKKAAKKVTKRRVAKQSGRKAG